MTTDDKLDMRTAVRNRSACIYGPSGSYKTSNLGFIALWIYEHTAKVYGKGRPSRLITFDGGGYDPLVPYIDAGLIEVYAFKDSIKDVFNVIDKLSKGFWPTDSEEQMLKSWTNTLTEDPIGAYLIEGITSMGDKLSENLTEFGPKLASQSAFRHETVSADGEKFVQHGMSMAYYGYVQSTLLKFMSAFNRLPVERVVWTALETEGEDETSGATVLGPKAKGKALTGDLPQKFGECIHFEPYEVAEVEGKGPFKRKEMGVRAWFKPHPQTRTGKVYAAKPRVPSFMVGELDKMFPQGYIELQPETGVEQLFKIQMELMNKQASTLKDLKAKIDSKNNGE